MKAPAMISRNHRHTPAPAHWGALGLLLLAAAFARADSLVPPTMSYSGFLTEADGTPIAAFAPQTRNFEFRIYAQATGGTPLWAEAQTVTIDQGHFGVILGEGTSVSGAPSGIEAFLNVIANATSANLHLGITPQGGEEFSPRQRLLSSPFAQRALVAERVSQATGSSVLGDARITTATLNGNLRLARQDDGRANFIEFGATTPGKHPDAGKILYQAYSNGVDIFGAGTSTANRRLTLWAEGGTHLHGPISFEPDARQNITMGASTNGIGIQNSGVVFFRSSNQFDWYRAGAFHPSAGNAGSGGNRLATLSIDGFHLRSGFFSGDGSGLTNFNSAQLPNNYNYLGINLNNHMEFGRGIANKPPENGRIAYNRVTGTFFGTPITISEHLDIFGAGTTTANRRIRLWADQGVVTTGPASISGALTVGGSNSTTISGTTVSNGSFLAQGASTIAGTITARSNLEMLGSGTLNFNNLVREAQLINLWSETGQPSYAIGVNGGVARSVYLRTQTRFAWHVGGAHSASGPGGTMIANWDNARCEFNVPVLIDSHLEVGATAQRNINYAFYARAGNGNPSTGGTSGIVPVAIYAHNRIVGSEFNAVSDARLKSVLRPSDPAADLDTLTQIEIVDYTLKDRVEGGGQPLKKVIAQQVESVFPQAVSQTRGIVPDVYQKATAESGFLTMPDAHSHGLQPGDTLRVLREDRAIESEILAVREDGVQLAADDLDGEVFVYGRRVGDMCSVDYDAIAMLNVSATREVHRRINHNAATIATCRDEQNDLARDAASLTESLQLEDHRLKAIEAGISQMSQVRLAPPATGDRQLARTQ